MCEIKAANRSMESNSTSMNKIKSNKNECSKKINKHRKMTILLNKSTQA